MGGMNLTEMSLFAEGAFFDGRISPSSEATTYHSEVATVQGKNASWWIRY
jgi:hypothetical protein